MKFFLLLTLFGVDSQDMTYAIDTNLTGEECIAQLEKHQALLEQTFYSQDFVLTCQLDQHED